MSDRRLVHAAVFLRSLATGMIGVLLGIHLARLDLQPVEMGAVIGAGLGGGAVAALLATMAADRLGRRRFLVYVALLGAAGGAVFSASVGLLLLGFASFIGMLNGMGRDRGASLIIEQSILAATTTDSDRTKAFATYNAVQDTGHALGGLLAAALPQGLRSFAGVEELASLRLSLGVYSLLILVTAGIYTRLSSSAGSPVRGGAVVSRESRSVLLKISSLFALDSLGGGFLTTSLLTFFFFKRFGAAEGTVGLLFFAARILNALSHLGAARLARRIGLVNTMVVTHIPSSFLLMTVPFAPNFPVAAFLFLLREGLVEMDVPTRQSYVMAVVRPEERTFASGVTHLVRLGAWAVAPPFAGLFMQGLSLGAPLVVGAAMKIVYDGLLYSAFRRIRPPEEVRAEESS